jgi:hypothetical protein
LAQLTSGGKNITKNGQIMVGESSNGKRMEYPWIYDGIPWNTMMEYPWNIKTY